MQVTIRAKTQRLNVNAEPEDIPTVLNINGLDATLVNDITIDLPFADDVELTENLIIAGLHALKVSGEAGEDIELEIPDAPKPKAKAVPKPAAKKAKK